MKKNINESEYEYEISKKELKKKLKKINKSEISKSQKIADIKAKLKIAEAELAEFNKTEKKQISLLQKKINNNLKSILGNVVLNYLFNDDNETQKYFLKKINTKLNARDKKKFVENFDFVSGDVKKLEEQNIEECKKEIENLEVKNYNDLSEDENKIILKIIKDKFWKFSNRKIYGRVESEQGFVYLDKSQILNITKNIAAKLISDYNAK